MAEELQSLLEKINSEGIKKAVSIKWLILALAAMASNGVATLFQKIYGKTNVGVEGADTTFLCMIYLFAALFAE